MRLLLNPELVAVVVAGWSFGWRLSRKLLP